MVDYFYCPENLFPGVRCVRRSSILVLLVAIGCAWSLGHTAATERSMPNPSSSALELALHYDFLFAQDTHVGDISGKKHHGQLRGGKIVEGRRKNAVKFEGQGTIAVADTPENVNPQSRPLTVGAFCKPASADGVLLAMGDKENGFSLYLKDGVPNFAVRAQGELFKVTGDEPVVLEQWIHLAGAIDAKGKVWLIVNAWPKASVEGKLVPRTPSEPFSVGADTGSPVGDYTTAMHWHGLVQDIRLYWGFMDRNENKDQWGDWADLPGCGCRK